MQPDPPLLTIAIPTYNRARFLRELLETLAPQLQNSSQVELIVSDNCSPDETPQVIEEFKRSGLDLRHLRNRENIGSDANFVQCFELAKGRYFLLFGDDDILVEGSIAKILAILTACQPELLYLSSYSFTRHWQAERRGDPLHRSYSLMTDSLQFARTVNVMFTFISGIIVDRSRLAEIGCEPPFAFLHSNLVQLSWALPLLLSDGNKVCVWERLVGSRINNSGGYNIAEVFGTNLKEITGRILQSKNKLARALPNAALRRWFPAALLELRERGGSREELEEISRLLQKEYSWNFRLWLFVYPVLSAPLPLAKFWARAVKMMNQGVYVMHFPGFWRKPAVDLKVSRNTT